MTSAALLPRFFDSKSEFGAGGAPYAADALKVGAAVLRSEPTGAVQKLLADGLASARVLDGADFQRANLRNGYWGRTVTGTAVSAVGADFFRADLSAASLRAAHLTDAVFVEAQLVGTSLVDADLRRANFNNANLRAASFTNANLADATFAGARHVSEELLQSLDADGRFTGGHAPARVGTTVPRRTVFLSSASHHGDRAAVLIAQIRRGLADGGVDLVTFPPDEYGKGAPLDEVTRRIDACSAVIVLGLPQLVAAAATWRVGTDAASSLEQVSWATPWNQIEAGVAAALDKPLLIIRAGVTEGVFEIGDQPHAVTVLDLSGPDALSGLDQSVRTWAESLGTTRQRSISTPRQVAG